MGYLIFTGSNEETDSVSQELELVLPHTNILNHITQNVNLRHFNNIAPLNEHPKLSS
jgi:hypothetical protein